MIGDGKGWAKGAEYVPRQLCEICATRFYAPPVLIRRGGGRFCSKSCRATWQVQAGKFGKPVRGHRVTCHDLGGIVFKSRWEANWAHWLEWLKSTGNVLSWQYEPDSFPLRVRGNNVRYIPDFKVEWNGKTEYHEVKGLMDQRSRDKIRAMRRQHNRVRLMVIDSRVYHSLRRRFNQIVPGWARA